jgi:hypothetical protein
MPHLRLYRQATAVALIVAPAIFLLDNVLHPKEFTRDHEAQQLARIGDAYTRWQVAHFLGLIALLTFSAAMLGLAFLVRRRQPALGLAGGALSVVGLIGLGGAIALDGYTWGILGEVSTRNVDSATVQLALHDVQQSEWSLQFYALGAAWILGIVMLALGAMRQGAVPPAAAWLLALGGLAVGIEAAVENNAYFIVSAAVLLAGAAAVGASLWRMSDEEFAAGVRSTS